MKLTIFSTTLLLLIFFRLSLSLAQSISEGSRRSIRIGEEVPDFIMRDMINYPSSFEHLGAFKGKLVILYFWNEGCQTSIHEWPKLLALQKKYEGHIQILLANESQGIKPVRKIIDDQARIAGVKMTLPVICNDAMLNKTFPRKTVPHIVWIDAESRLISITRDDQVNERNVGAIVSGKPMTMPQKDGVKYAVDFSKPLFANSNGGPGDHVQWQSVVSNYFPGIYGTMYVDSTFGIFSNSLVTTMFRYLFKEETNRFGALNMLPESRLELRVSDASRYSLKAGGENQNENFYTYQLYTKSPRPKEVIRSLMLADLKRYFGLDCYWTRQRKNCLVLSVLDPAKLSSPQGTPKIGMSSTAMDLNNISATELLQNLVAVTDYHHSPYPMLDETGLKQNLGRIQFDADVHDYKSLNNGLNAFGLQLTLQSRDIDVLVVYEPNYFRPGKDSLIAN